jgi:hypothetical protein
VDAQGKILREAKVASEPDALGPVDNLPNRIFAVGGFPW